MIPIVSPLDPAGHILVNLVKHHPNFVFPGHFDILADILAKSVLVLEKKPRIRKGRKNEGFSRPVSDFVLYALHAQGQHVFLYPIWQM
jgi:hypothetical protein